MYNSFVTQRDQAGLEIFIFNLGTAAYMSPEQARGKPLDNRTDIWAFGVVLFEMLIGQVCFDGETVIAVLVAVMRADPDWTKLPAAVPSRLRRQRLQAIGDTRIELEEIAAAAPEAEAATLAPGGAGNASVPTRRARWALLAAALSPLAAVITNVLSGVWPPAAPQLPLRVSIVHTDGNELGRPANSPDGTRVAYRARGAGGVPRIWVRRLGSSVAQPLQGTEEGQYPFWSPDSRKLGFSSARRRMACWPCGHRRLSSRAQRQNCAWYIATGPF
jgi:serine/threonine protein kinase